MSLLVIIAASVSAIPYLYLLLLPFTNIKFTKKQVLCAIFFIVAVAFFLAKFMPTAAATNSIYYLMWRHFFALSITASILLTGKYVFKIPLLPLLTVTLITQCYIVNYVNFSWILREILFHPAFHTNLPLIKMFIPNMLVLACTLPLVSMFYIKLIRPVVDLNKEDSKLWNVLWVFPLTFYIINNIVLPLDRFKNYLTSSPVLLFHLQIAWFVTTFSILGILLLIIIDSNQKAVLEEKIHTSELHMYLQKKEYTRIQDLLEETRRARHDLRQHLLVLKNFAMLRDLDGIKDYINDYLNNMDLESPTSLCENQAISALVQYYLNIARKENIEILTTLNVPAEIPFSDMDITIIFGNILENAIEACLRQKEGKRFIEIKALFTKTNMLALTVKNSYSQEVKIDEEGNYISSKDQKTVGLGTTSIKTVTKKYNGITKFSHENGTFEVSVLLTPPTNE